MKKLFISLAILCFTASTASAATPNHPAYTAISGLLNYLNANEEAQASRINAQADDGLTKANNWSGNAILARFTYTFTEGKQTSCKLEYISALDTTKIATALCPEDKETVEVKTIANKENLAGINDYLELKLRDVLTSMQSDKTLSALIGSGLLGEESTANITLKIELFQNRSGKGQWIFTLTDNSSGKTIKLRTFVTKYKSRFSF